MGLHLVGSISGEVKPTQFDVLLSDAAVERGSYVKVKHDVYGWVLARIESMKRYLNEFDEEKILAKARTVGYKQDNTIFVPKNYAFLFIVPFVNNFGSDKRAEFKSVS